VHFGTVFRFDGIGQDSVVDDGNDFLGLFGVSLEENADQLGYLDLEVFFDF